MKVALLKIENFRGISAGEIQFRDHTVLIGPNNSSKTTVIEALALILGRDRLVRNLTEHDFFGSNPGHASRIKITATLTGFDSEDFTEHADWFGDRRGVPFWFDPQDGGVLPEKTKDHQELACQVVFSARFDRENLEVETARYFNDGDEIDVFAEDYYISVPQKLIRDIGFFLIPANRSWDRMLSFSSELFRRVIRSTNGLPAETILEERDRLRNPEHKLEEDERFNTIVSEVNQETNNLLGTLSQFQLRLTATDSMSVLESVVPHFQNEDNAPIPSKRQGSGLVSLQSLFLLLHFGQQRIKDGESFFMALEEPELHLPPAVQRRVLSRLQSLSTQTIVTTHSPLVAGFCNAKSLLIIRNEGGVLNAAPMMAEPIQQDTTNAIRRLFQINRVETAAAMMSEFVLVPEGRYDFDWLTLLLRVVELDSDNEQPCFFGVRVGVIPTDDAKVKETCETLAKAHPQVIALVDGDPDGIRYANALDESDVGARKVLLWPLGWMIEDVVGWIIGADENGVIGRLDTDLEHAPGDRTTLVTRLKSKVRAEHGLKGDSVAYEIIANAISESENCRTRVRRLLHGVAEACAGTNTQYFNAQVREKGQIPRLVFNP
ncbi:MAG: ATP-binding protein [Candidatus Thiodiazotropha taylori]|nr:ATP-binding protein [Candidatus Thiodiazotropha taylori]